MGYFNKIQRRILKMNICVYGDFIIFIFYGKTDSSITSFGLKHNHRSFTSLSEDI